MLLASFRCTSPPCSGAASKLSLSLTGLGLDYAGFGTFTGNGGSLRLERNGGMTQVLIDLDGDRQADMQINLIATHQVAESDFLL